MQENSRVSNRGYRALVESAFLAALAVVIILLMEYAPVLGTLAALVSPVPVAIVVSRHGLRWGLMSAVVATLISMTLLSPLVALASGLSLILGGLALGYGIARRLDGSKTIVLLTIAGIILIVSEFLLTAYVLGVGPEALLKQTAESIALGLKQGADLAARITGQYPSSIVPGTTVESIAATVEQTLRQTVAGLTVAAAAFNAYLNYVVSATLLRRFRINVDDLPPFSRWLFPPWFGLVFFLGTAGTIALGAQIQAWPWLRGILFNAVAAASLFSTVDGLSVFAYYLKRARMPGLLTVLIALYVVSSPPLAFLSQVCGALDTMVDFRKIRWDDGGGS